MKTVVNSGFYELLGTDRFDDFDKTFGKRYGEYRKKWREYPQKRIVGKFSLHLDVESTNACDLRCTMCSRNFMTERIGYIDWGLFKKIVDESAEYNLPSLKLNYRGEPLLHPKLPEMVKHAKDKGVLEVQFNTNGLLLTEKKSEELIKAGVNRIIFSVDGATKETYEKIRRGSNFETVVRNIKRFVEIRDSMGLKNPSVRVQMVKMKENQHEAEQFVKMWINIANRVALITRRDPCIKGPKKTKPLEHFPCPQLWQRLVVWWTGQAGMCCGDWHGEYLLGDVEKTSLYELWHSEKYNQVRELHAMGRFNEVLICTKCEINTLLADTELERLKRYREIGKR